MFIQNSSALNESQTSVRKDGLWFIKNGTLKSQTDYLFMCWFGGCFRPSCHTFLSNVKEPCSGCVTMHQVETETKWSPLSQIETVDSEDPSLAISLSSKLFGITSMNMDQFEKQENGISSPDPLLHLGVLGVNQSMCSERRWEVNVWWRTSVSQEMERER